MQKHGFPIWILTILMLAGCSESNSDGGDTDTEELTTDSQCTVGSEGCACTVGGACDPGLSCHSDICVDVGGDADLLVRLRYTTRVY